MIGSKWSISGLRKVLRANNVDDNVIFNRIKDIIIKTFMSVENEMKSNFLLTVPHKNNCFQLFGFDIMIDEKLNPWLLEINANSSLSCDSPLDHKIKSGLITDLFNLVGINNIDL